MLAFYQLLLRLPRIERIDADLLFQVYHFLLLEISLVNAYDAKSVPSLLLLACVLIRSFHFRNQTWFVDLLGLMNPLKLGQLFLLVIVVNNGLQRLIYQRLVSVLESPLLTLAQINLFGNAVEYISGLLRGVQMFAMSLQLNDLFLTLLQLSLVCIRLRFGNTTLNLTSFWVHSTLILLL